MQATEGNSGDPRQAPGSIGPPSRPSSRVQLEDSSRPTAIDINELNRSRSFFRSQRPQPAASGRTYRGSTDFGSTHSCRLTFSHTHPRPKHRACCWAMAHRLQNTRRKQCRADRGDPQLAPISLGWPRPRVRAAHPIHREPLDRRGSDRAAFSNRRGSTGSTPPGLGRGPYISFAVSGQCS